MVRAKSDGKPASSSTFGDAGEARKASEADGPVATDDEELRLVVIGAGPHALSLLLRLVEEEADLLEEGDRAHIMAKAGSRARSHTDVRKKLKKRVDGGSALRGVRVIDVHGEWMANWRLDFGALEIEHLRSHADLHPCPFDFQSLRVWAEMQKRTNEMWHMQYLCRDTCRASGYGGPYVLPSTKLFNDFCASLVTRYKLASLVRKGEVSSVVVEQGASAEGQCKFVLTLSDGSNVRAERIVCAMGPGPMFAGMRSNMPWWCAQLLTGGPWVRVPRVCHSSELMWWLKAEGERKAALRGKRVLVVGGGQTAGHLALLALKHGCVHVSIAARRRISRKPYDVDLCLIGDSRGSTLDKFWKMDLRQRTAFIASVRGGGSMADEVYAGLLEHCGEEGRLSIREEVEVTHARLLHAHASIGRGKRAAATAAKATTKAVATEAAPAAVAEVENTAAVAAAAEMEAREAATTTDADAAQAFEKSLVLDERAATTAEAEEVESPSAPATSIEPKIKSEFEIDPKIEIQSEIEINPEIEIDPEIEIEPEIEVSFDDGDGDVYDYVWLATGGELDISLVPFFSSLLEQRPVPLVRGLPALQDDLSWDDRCPLYVMGAFAQLQLGADALNLAGSRAGSVRIASVLRPWLRRP